MGIWFLAHNSAIFCLIWIQIHIKEPDATTSRATIILVLGMLMIWQNLAKNKPNMDMASLQILVGGLSSRHPKSLTTGPSLSGN